jgi:hypothetical protein
MGQNRYEGLIVDGVKEVWVNGEIMLDGWEQPNWGYAGGGPAMVAEAIMINEFGSGVDRGLILVFKEEIVAKWFGQAGWVLTSEQIEEWHNLVDKVDKNKETER